MGTKPPRRTEDPSVSRWLYGPVRRVLQRLSHPTWRDAFAVGVPILLVLLAVAWAMHKFVRPAPPDHLTITTGSNEGAYQIFAARYKDVFERNHVKLVIEPSAGALQNLDRLLDPSRDVDVGFVQSGLIGGRDTTGLVSLGLLYPEPLWLFHRKSVALKALDDLRGMRIGVGPEGSGTRVLALELLRAHGIDGASAQLSAANGIAAAQQLAGGALDAVFVVGAAHSSAVWALLYSPGVNLFSFTQAEAYARRLPHLSVLSLPRGPIDVQRAIPDRDVTLVGPTATLLAREDTHPALLDLLLLAATEVHGGAGLFQSAGQYPAPRGVELPLSPEAERFYRSGQRFLHRYLPFWAATLVDRLLIMLLPLIAIFIPLSRLAPALYTWRVRSRVFRYYGQLKLLEHEAQHSIDSRSPQQWMDELDRIEYAAYRISTPLAFANHVYTLRQHVHMVRDMLRRRLGAAAPAMAPSPALTEPVDGA